MNFNYSNVFSNKNKFKSTNPLLSLKSSQSKKNIESIKKPKKSRLLVNNSSNIGLRKNNGNVQIPSKSIPSTSIKYPPKSRLLVNNSSNIGLRENNDNVQIPSNSIPSVNLTEQNKNNKKKTKIDKKPIILPLFSFDPLISKSNKISSKHNSSLPIYQPSLPIPSPSLPIPPPLLPIPSPSLPIPSLSKSKLSFNSHINIPDIISNNNSNNNNNNLNIQQSNIESSSEPINIMTYINKFKNNDIIETYYRPNPIKPPIIVYMTKKEYMKSIKSSKNINYSIPYTQSNIMSYINNLKNNDIIETYHKTNSIKPPVLVYVTKKQYINSIKIKENNMSSFFNNLANDKIIKILHKTNIKKNPTMIFMTKNQYKRLYKRFKKSKKIESNGPSAPSMNIMYLNYLNNFKNNNVINVLYNDEKKTVLYVSKKDIKKIIETLEE